MLDVEWVSSAQLQLYTDSAGVQAWVVDANWMELGHFYCGLINGQIRVS